MVASLLRDMKMDTVQKVRAKLRRKWLDLSVSAARNIAHLEWLRSAVPRPKPKLTLGHRAARLACVKTHRDDDEKKIQNLVFVDVKKFIVTDDSPRI